MSTNEWHIVKNDELGNVTAIGRSMGGEVILFELGTEVRAIRSVPPSIVAGDEGTVVGLRPLSQSEPIVVRFPMRNIMLQMELNELEPVRQVP